MVAGKFMAVKKAGGCPLFRVLIGKASNISVLH